VTVTTDRKCAVFNSSKIAPNIDYFPPLAYTVAGADARFQLRNLFQVPAAVSTAINAVADAASTATQAVTAATAPISAAATDGTASPVGAPAPAASPSPQLVGGRAGVYVLTEPPPMPVVNETAPAATAAAGNVTGPAKPAPGNNLMVRLKLN
jgi:hypothetical protein